MLKYRHLHPVVAMAVSLLISACTDTPAVDHAPDSPPTEVVVDETPCPTADGSPCA